MKVLVNFTVFLFVRTVAHLLSASFATICEVFALSGVFVNVELGKALTIVIVGWIFIATTTDVPVVAPMGMGAATGVALTSASEVMGWPACACTVARVVRNPRVVGVAVVWTRVRYAALGCVRSRVCLFHADSVWLTLGLNPSLADFILSVCAVRSK